jgi:GNAT superfamily N-acetyltransferase
MSRADESALVEFFSRIPQEERYFLKDDVTSPLLIREWIEELDYNKVLPLLALDDRTVVADAALLRHRSAAFGHAAEIRIVIDPGWRSRGLAVGLMNELAKVAGASGLEEVVFEFVRGVQDAGIEAAEYLGATTEAVLSGWVRGQDGTPHDVVFLRLPLGQEGLTDGDDV